MRLVFLRALLVAQAADAPTRNPWPEAYAKKSAAAAAADFEAPERALFRYRVAMAGLMQLAPGMQVGEMGAGSGFLSSPGALDAIAVVHARLPRSSRFVRSPSSQRPRRRRN